MHTLNLEIFINEYIKIPQTESLIIIDIKIFAHFQLPLLRLELSKLIHASLCIILRTNFNILGLNSLCTNSLRTRIRRKYFKAKKKVGQSEAPKKKRSH